MRTHNKTWKSVIRLFRFQTPLPRFQSCRTTWAPLQRLSPTRWRVNALSSSDFFCDLLKANPRPVTHDRRERLLCGVNVRITGNTENWKSTTLENWNIETVQHGKSDHWKTGNTGPFYEWKQENPLKFSHFFSQKSIFPVHAKRHRDIKINFLYNNSFEHSYFSKHIGMQNHVSGKHFAMEAKHVIKFHCVWQLLDDMVISSFFEQLLNGIVNEVLRKT